MGPMELKSKHACFVCFSPYLAFGCLAGVISKLNIEISKAIFFGIVTTHNNQISHLKHILDPFCMSVTSFGHWVLYFSASTASKKKKITLKRGC